MTNIPTANSLPQVANVVKTVLAAAGQLTWLNWLLGFGYCGFKKRAICRSRRKECLMCKYDPQPFRRRTIAGQLLLGRRALSTQRSNPGCEISGATHFDRRTCQSRTRHIFDRDTFGSWAPGYAAKVFSKPLMAQ